MAEQARLDHFAFTITRHDLEPLAEWIWQLRHQLRRTTRPTLALAEALPAPLCTCDAKLTAARHDAEVQVFPRTH